MSAIRHLAVPAALLALSALPAQAASLATLYGMGGTTSGQHPQGTVLPGAGGVLFSTASSGGAGGFGTAFALVPSGAAGHYNVSVLHAFKGGQDGAAPDQGLTAGANGALFGVTPQGGGSGCGGAGCGTVFALAPGAGGKGYAEKVLYRFTGGTDGGAPEAALVMDGTGVLYGTTSTGGTGYGTVFALTPTNATGGFKFSTLYSFQGGTDGATPQFGALTVGAGGVLYGATYFGGTSCAGSGNGCGTVFSLTPPAAAGGAWTESVLYRFTGGADGGFAPGGLTVLADGSLAGVTDKGRTVSRTLIDGSVFKLTPVAGGGWQFATLYTFGTGGDGATPNAGLAADAAGALYGTTIQGGSSGGACLPLYGCGTAFKLTPPVAPATAWTETVLYRFAGGADGAAPEAGLTPDGAGSYYGTASSLMLLGNNGSVFKLTP